MPGSPGPLVWVLFPELGGCVRSCRKCSSPGASCREKTPPFRVHRECCCSSRCPPWGSCARRPVWRRGACTERRSRAAPRWASILYGHGLDVAGCGLRPALDAEDFDGLGRDGHGRQLLSGGCCHSHPLEPAAERFRGPFRLWLIRSESRGFSIAAAVFTSAFSPSADLGVGDPTGERLRRGGQVDRHHLSGGQIHRGGGAEFRAVGQVDFDPDLAQGVAGGILHRAGE